MSGSLNSALKIKRVNRDNVKDFITLTECLARYEQDTPPDDAAKRRLEADALSENPPFHVFLSYLDGRLVGHVVYYFTYSTYDGRRVLFLEDIFVREEARMKGVGKELFRHCLCEAEKEGCCEIQWAVLTWNEDAIAFYERMGGKRRDIYVYGIKEGDECWSPRKNQYGRKSDS